jgi:hypothetical protein
MACLKKRGEKYYAQYYVAGRQKRVNLDTDSYQLAKEKLRKVESALLRGSAMPLPTQSPYFIADQYCGGGGIAAR